MAMKDEDDPQKLEARRQRLREMRERGPVAGGEIGAVNVAEMEGRRRALRELRETARLERAAGAVPGVFTDAPADSERVAPVSLGGPQPGGQRDRGKQLATMFLDALHSGPRDAPKVPGSVFTQAGIDRFMAMLTQRAQTDGGTGQSFFKRIHRMCTTPAGDAENMVNGVNIAGIAKAAELLERIQLQGLEEALRSRSPIARDGSQGGWNRQR
jgi:hypothetical protein